MRKFPQTNFQIKCRKGIKERNGRSEKVKTHTISCLSMTFRYELFAINITKFLCSFMQIIYNSFIQAKVGTIQYHKE
ncbi:hypothetical protein KFK09_017472 [Dendrobium nobile]|uniref:Uncharacterized protein n=1 Tax=Dendrobium nobile TaxID=94219 RepID=A0A8T3B1F1_DENNO|nr:hypothetical protein KFK09_017472 [Dendrobium nobile]